MLLILPAIMGGSIGSWIAMYVFRHKTKQKRIIFVLGKATKILSHTEYMNKALSDGKLYLEIVKHRERFYHPSYVDYSRELPEVIDFLPPATVEDAFRSDYNEMRSSFIYEKDPLSFDELLKNIAAIQEQFRKCVISE